MSLVITREQFFQAKPHSAAQAAAADDLLERNNRLRAEFEAATGRALPPCPNTGSGISGSKGGAGDGGFRLDTATTGGEHSSHKILYAQRPDGSWARDPDHAQAAVDNYDPNDHLDEWLDTFEYGAGGNSKLEEYGLFREAPGSTPGWCHLTTRAPHSGRRTFQP